MNHPNPPPKPSWRKPAGMALILLLLLVVALVVVSQADRIGALPIWVQSIIYLIIGTVWIAPLRPLLIWMETGKWRE
jgi:Protein of unknown function (DUF2842)